MLVWSGAQTLDLLQGLRNVSEVQLWKVLNLRLSSKFPNLSLNWDVISERDELDCDIISVDYLIWTDYCRCIECKLYIPSMIVQPCGMYSSVNSCNCLASRETPIRAYISRSTTFTICNSLLPFMILKKTNCLSKFSDISWIFHLSFFGNGKALLVIPLHCNFS